MQASLDGVRLGRPGPFADLPCAGAVALAGGLTGPVVFGGDGLGGPREVVLLATTGGLSLVLVWLSLRLRRPGAVVAAVIGGAAIAGALNAGLVLGTTGAIGAHGLVDAAITLLAGLVGGSLLGLFIGAPLGLAFGAAYAVLVGVVATLRAPALDAAPARWLAVGTWLGVSAAALAPFTPLASVLSIASIVSVTAATVEIVRLGRFVDRVARGVEPRLTLGIPTETEAAAVPRAFLFGDADGIVRRTSTSAAGPFRDGLSVEPLVRVPRRGWPRLALALPLAWSLAIAGAVVTASTEPRTARFELPSDGPDFG